MIIFRNEAISHWEKEAISHWEKEAMKHGCDLLMLYQISCISCNMFIKFIPAKRSQISDASIKKHVSHNKILIAQETMYF